MTKRRCSIPGCPKPHKGHGYCGTHYARWRKTGDPGSAESLRLPKPLPPCSAQECDSAARSSGALYCEKHYYRLRRTGELTAASWHRHGQCSADSCDEPEYEIGYCAKHAMRMRRHGDPDVFIAHKDRNLPRGAAHRAWMGEDVGYAGAHDRVESLKGRASSHLCVDCGEPALHWSYDHADPDQKFALIDGRGPYPYSLDPDHYVPRCVKCHKRFDLSVKRDVCAQYERGAA